MDRIVNISIDAMSGDHGVNTTVPAALKILAVHPNLHLILVGDQVVLEAALRASRFDEALRTRIRLHHASEVVAMDDPPAVAMRNKKDSSMRVAVNLVKEGEADACVSAGNTGALMAISRFVLKMIPGIDRPAICSAMPSTQGYTHMMDLGANVDSSSEHLYQFAQMGTVLCQAIDEVEKPRIGLLNIGEEDIKGNDQVRQAAAVLSESALNYVGFVEGNDIFGNVANVIICDGFVGNVSLKTSEGVAKFITDVIAAEFRHNILSKCMAFMAQPVLKRIKKQLDPRRYNGASLLGLQGIVIKSHGGADPLAFRHAIQIAIKEVQMDVPKHIAEQLESEVPLQGVKV